MINAEIDKELDKELGEDQAFLAAPAGEISPQEAQERYRIIAQTLEQIRPGLQSDGGDMELVSVDGYKVKVRLKGACVSCGASNATLGGIRRSLSQALRGGPVLVIPAL